MKVKARTINKIIKESLLRSMSYSDYSALMSNLVSKGMTTGANPTAALGNYTMLNEKRMKRLDKKVTLSAAVEQKVNLVQKTQTWLVLTESWCGDAAHIIQVLNKIAELNPNITLKVVLRDENEALMNAFLTNGNKAIPKLIMYDEQQETVLDAFGPRPSVATAMVNEYKQKNGALDAEFKKDLQLWYNKDKGQNTVKDVLKLLEKQLV